MRPDPGGPVPASATNTRPSAPTAIPRGLLRPLAAIQTDGPAASAGAAVTARIVRAPMMAAANGARRKLDKGHLLRALAPRRAASAAIPKASRYSGGPVRSRAVRGRSRGKPRIVVQGGTGRDF